MIIVVRFTASFYSGVTLDLHLANKVILVTGSSKGIGLSIAKMLNTQGCHVVLNARNADELNRSVSSLPGAIGVVADVTSPDHAKRLVTEVIEKFGRIDHLVCNVGSGQSVSPGDETYDEWQRVFAKNLWSTTNVVEASVDELSKNQGSIVCTSSICGLEVIQGAPVTYSTAKAALHAYVCGISRPLGKKNIRINAIAAGNILFQGSVWERKIEENADIVSEMCAREVSLNKLGLPEDIANLTTYLLSPISSFVTGAVWTIDGGQVRSSV